MRIRNLLGMGMLLGLAACEGESKEETGTDTVPEETDTETETTDTYTYTEETGPITVDYFYESANFAIDESGALISLDYGGYPIPPTYFIVLGNDDEGECYIQVDLSAAVVTPGEGAQYITLTAAAPAITDGCQDLIEFSFEPGVNPADFWAGQTFVVTVGPYDEAFFSNYGATADPATTIGGTLSDTVFFGNDYYPAEPALGVVYPLDGMGGYSQTPIASGDVQIGAGVTPGFYILNTLVYGFQ